MSHYRYLNDDNEREFANHRWSRASSIHSNDDVDRIVPAVEYGSNNSHLANAAADARETSSTEQQLVSETAKKSNVGEKSSTPLLRHRRTSVWLLACYLPFLILPWILTNIMAYRPPSLPSYNIQKPEHCSTRYLAVVLWFAFVRILNSIASVLVVPVTSALQYIVWQTRPEGISSCPIGRTMLLQVRCLRSGQTKRLLRTNSM